MVNIINNWLYIKHSLYSSAYFTFLSILVNLLLSGNDMCHSQPKPYSFINSNVSRSMHCSSVEAYLLWKYCSLILISVAKCDAQPIAWDILLELTSVAGKLCNKCPKQLLKQNSSCSAYFNVISGLYQTAEPQESLWQYNCIFLGFWLFFCLLQWLSMRNIFDFIFKFLQIANRCV